ncbi:RAB6-interacting golgin [Salix suchowensis]|nr:RAB6-interacting golgin [Salix suchowensis]
MSSSTNLSTMFKPEIGPDGLPREAPVIAYTEKIIEEEQLQLRKYIEENYSKIRGVERELGNLTLEMKLTAGPKKAALEHLRKKIEMSTERIRVAKLKEEEARKALEAATKVVKEEEEIKQKLCEDLNQLVQESSSSQFSRLEELKRRLEALNPSRASMSSPPHDALPLGPASNSPAQDASIPLSTAPNAGVAEIAPNQTNGGNVQQVTDGKNQQPNVEGEGRGKKKVHFQGRGRGIGAVPKGRGSAQPGWTGAGFDVDGRS